MNTSCMSKVALFVAVAAVSLFAGCGAGTGAINELDPKVVACRDQTRATLVTTLRPQMSTDDFIKQFSVDAELYKVGLSVPYKSETRLAEFGDHEPVILLVQWYYTDLKRNDGRVTKDELTPVVSAEGSIMGWGSEFLEQIHEYVERKQAEAKK